MGRRKNQLRDKLSGEQNWGEGKVNGGTNLVEVEIGIQGGKISREKKLGETKLGGRQNQGRDTFGGERNWAEGRISVETILAKSETGGKEKSLEK